MRYFFLLPPPSLALRSTPNAGPPRRSSSKGGQTEAHMRLNVLAFALTAGLFWAVTVFLVQTLNALLPPYGGPFLVWLASLYPFYRPEESYAYVLLGMFYGFLDGLICGAIFSWVYNRLAERFSTARR